MDQLQLGGDSDEYSASALLLPLCEIKSEIAPHEDRLIPPDMV